MKRIILASTVSETFTIFGQFPEYLRDNGWSVVLMSSPGSHLDKLEDRGFTVERVPMTRDPAVVADAKSTVHAYRVLTKYPGSILLVGTPKASLLLLAASKVLGYPIRIYDVKGLRYEGATGAKRAIFRAAEVVTMALSSHILAISPSIMTKIHEDNLSLRREVTLLGQGADNGVDIEHFSPDDSNAAAIMLKVGLGIPSSHTVVGYVGRINRDKGLNELAEVARKFRAQREPITFLVVGPDDGAGYQPFSGTDTNVVRVGWVDDPKAYFEAFDIFCLPTYREGLPNVNLQASSMGLPVITTDATGAVDSVEHEVTGLIVPHKSADSLFSAISLLHHDRELARILGKQGREWVQERYNTRKVWKARLEWLNNLWESTRPR